MSARQPKVAAPQGEYKAKCYTGNMDVGRKPPPRALMNAPNCQIKLPRKLGLPRESQDVFRDWNSELSCLSAHGDARPRRIEGRDRQALLQERSSRSAAKAGA